MKMNRFLRFKLKLLRNWHFPLRERLVRLLLPQSKDFRGIVHTSNGCLIKADSSSYIEYKVLTEGGYETHITKLIQLYLKDQTLFVDIGANIGIHSLSIACKRRFHVIAVEPIEFIRTRLHENIYLNQCSNYIEVIPVALSNENKVIKTNFSDSIKNMGTFDIRNVGDGKTEIQCIIGDEILLDKGKISVIKIDVEGFEYSVLRGLKKTISQNKPIIIFELDTHYLKRDNSTVNDFISFFENISYKLYLIDTELISELTNPDSINGMVELLALPSVI